ncbi:peptidoglycan DD-metalloendopeptidase family protein [Thioalkalivibrio sp. ALgr1]|uniref:murein hydrolase activator EnvC family protein n=1 Tax=Thioalkalivibrio sp. ALgr1 TaxID=748655 RepID=UPI00057120E2
MRICAILTSRYPLLLVLAAFLLAPAGSLSAFEPEAELEETLEAIRDLERSQEERQAALERLEDELERAARGSSESRRELRELEAQREQQSEVIAEHEARVEQEEERLREERVQAGRLLRDQWQRDRHPGRVPGTGGEGELSRLHPEIAARLREARAEALAALGEQLEVLRAARDDLEREQAVLAEQEAALREVVADLEREEERQRVAMDELERAIADEALELARLERNAETLEDLIREVERDAAEREERAARGDPPPERAPVRSDVAFADLQGELPMPADGSVVRRFNEPRGSRLQSRWRGTVLEVDSGESVHAVHFGRVVYADWMQGYGFLVILDHGSGYLTLYSNLEEILVAEGEEVEGGTRMALAGAGREAIAPGLYFEIRRNGDPLNPEDWWLSQ